MNDFKPGDKVHWESQSQGTWKLKYGFFIMIIEPGEDATAFLPPDLPKSRFKGERISKIRRALVEVVTGKYRPCNYYAPRLSALQPGWPNF